MGDTGGQNIPTDHQMPSLKKPIKPFFNPSAPPDEEHSNDALLTLAMFSFVMFTLPIGIFYFGKILTFLFK